MYGGRTLCWLNLNPSRTPGSRSSLRFRRQKQAFFYWISIVWANNIMDLTVSRNRTCESTEPALVLQVSQFGGMNPGVMTILLRAVNDGSGSPTSLHGYGSLSLLSFYKAAKWWLLSDKDTYMISGIVLSPFAVWSNSCVMPLPLFKIGVFSVTKTSSWM